MTKGLHQSVMISAHSNSIKIAWENLGNHLPRPVAQLMMELPTTPIKVMNRVRETAREVGEKLFDEKWSVVGDDNEDDKRDVMSILGKLSLHELCKCEFKLILVTQ
jgi:hypothetical protein